jgi:hypothetical protein
LQPSTYSGHQEGSGQNRGIDWFPTGHADMSGQSYSPEETQRLQNFATALQAQMPGMDPEGQVIFSDLGTGQDTGVAHGAPVGPGTADPGYYRDDWKDHHGHVHTSFSMSEPVPGNMINPMITPGQRGQSPYPTAPQQPAQPHRQQPQVTLTSASIGGDLGLSGLDDGTNAPLTYPWQTAYGYKHGTEPFSGIIGMFPGSDKFMHPFRGGQNPFGGNAAPAPAQSEPAPPSAITASLMSRTAPDLDHVGAGKGAGARPVNITHNYQGITTPAKIAPAIMETHLAATRATVPRTFT